MGQRHSSSSALSQEQERKIASEIAQTMKARMLVSYPDPRRTLRADHPKTVGLLRGTFEISSDLLSTTKVGLFANAGTKFPCWIRFSKMDKQKRSDMVKDYYGCSIKLLSADGSTPLGQDFVLCNCPVNALGTVQLFRDIMWYSHGLWFVLLCIKLFFTCMLGRIRKYERCKTLPGSLLDERFYSQTPFALGGGSIVKYGLFPSDTISEPCLTQRTGFNYLTNEMAKRLEQGEVLLNFCVQLRTHPKRMPIEDAAIEWKTTDSPFIKVASVRIPKQDFENATRAELSEVLAFDVGNALPEHKPLGNLNKIRGLVYKEMSKYRHDRAKRMMSEVEF